MPTKPPQDDSKEIKKMLQDLFKAVKVMSSASAEQSRINRELMKVMSLLNSGFVESADDANKLIDTIKDNGFSLTDEFIKKWAKARKATDEDLKNIVKRFKEIDNLSDDVIDSAKDYTDLLEDQIDSIETNIDLSTKLLRSQNKITDAIEASKKQANAFAGSTGDITQLTDKLLQKKVDLTGMFDGMFKGMENGSMLIDNIQSDIDALVQRASDSMIQVDFHFNPLSDDLNNEVKKTLDSIDEEKSKRLQGLQEYYSKNSDLQDKMAKQMAAQNFTKGINFDVNTSNITTAAGLLEQGTTEYQNVLDQLTKIVSDNKLGNVVGSNLKEMVSLLGKGVTLSESQNDQIIKYKGLLDDTNKIMFEQFDQRYKDLGTLQESINTEKSRLAIVGRYTSKLTAARGIVEKIGEGFDYIDGLLPSGVSDFLGISKVSLGLLDAHKKGMEKFSDHVKQGGDLTESMSVYMKEMGPSIRTALSPMTLLVAAGALLFQTLKTTVETYKQMASEMKISILQAKQLHEVQLDILTSQKNQFTTMEDITQIQTEMIQYGKNFYSLSEKGSKEMVINLSEAGKAFGYGSEQATKLQNTFTQLGANDDLALNLQQSLGFMSEMAGISPQIISQDLIDGADIVATYFAGMPAEAAKATLQIRRMGMSIQKAGEIAQNMLDLENFMTNMYELQAMTGGGIDFSNAFDKGLVGDIEGMTRDIMKDIGTTAEFNKMDYLTRTKIAKTLGMSADELGKSVKLNEQLAAFDGPMKEALEGNIERMGDISKLNKDQIRDRLQQLQSTDRLSVAWDKIKGVLLKAIIPLAESFADAIDAVSPFIDIIVGGLKIVGVLIKAISPIIKGMLWPFKAIGTILSSITGYLDGWGDTLKPINTTVSLFGYKFDLVKDTIYGIGVAIGTWALLFKMPAVLGSVVGVFKTILSFIPGVGTLIGSLTSGMGGMFGSLGKKSEDAAKESTDPLVNMTTKVQSSMSGMVESIKTSMDDMVTHIKASVSNAADSINKGFTKSPTTKLLQDIKTEGVSTSQAVANEAMASYDKMESSVTKGSDISKKKLKEIKAESANLIPVGPIKKSFGLITEIGTKALAVMATKTLSSYVFAQKEGAQQLSGTGAQMQGIIEMAAMGGSTFLVDALQGSVEKVFSRRFEKRIEGGFGNVTETLSKKLVKVGDSGKGIFGSITGKLTKGFGDVESSGKGVFSKIGSYGKSIFSKITSFGKSSLPETGESLVSSFDKVKDKLNPISSVTEKVEETVTKKSSKIELPKSAEKSVSSTGSIFEKLTKIIKGAWDTIKSVILDIVKFVGDALKSLTAAIGKSIENLLKGIGRGLSSFKTDAIKGAAALVLVSGALWITSKALENFANVSWESIGKGIVALGGLVVAALVLGKASGNILIGAAAIAILGASLIPAAFALNMFNSVDWESLAKAGVALVGLAVVGGVLGGMLPLMLLGAVGIAALGAAMIPMAFAMKMFNEIEWESLGKAGAALVGFGLIAAGFGLVAPLILAGALTIGVASISLLAFAGSVMAINISMKGLDIKPLKELILSLIQVTNISITSLFGVATGIAAISTSMMAFSAVGIGTSVAKLFGGDVIKDLERLGVLAEPLNTVNQVISQLAASILELSNVLGNADFDSIKKLNDIDVKSLDQDVNQRINTVSGNVQNFSEPSIGFKVAPQQTQTADVQTPKKESVAQNVRINNIPGTKQSNEESNGNSGSTNSSVSNSYYGDNSSGSDIYNRPGMETKKLEMLLMRMIQLMEADAQKNLVLQMNGQKVGTIIKKENNI